jgi:hypothetical protein
VARFHRPGFSGYASASFFDQISQNLDSMMFMPTEACLIRAKYCIQTS